MQNLGNPRFFKRFPHFPRNLRPNFRLYIRDGHNNKQTRRAISIHPQQNEKEEKEIKS